MDESFFTQMLKRPRLPACLPVIAGLFLTTAPGWSEDPIKDVFVATGGIRGESREIETGTISISEGAREWERVFSGGKVEDHFTHGNDNMIRALTYGEGRFVAAGNKGIGVMVSENGRDWRFAREELGGPGGFCIAFTDGKFLIPTANSFHVSDDGESWESTNMSPQLQERHQVGAWGSDGAGHVRKVVGVNGVFVFAGERRFGSTADGKTFLHHEILPAGEKQRNYFLLAGAGRFLYLHENGHRTSTDGVNWEPLVIESDDPEVVKEQVGGVWTGSEFVVPGAKAIYRSSDGLEWEKTPVESGPPSIITAGNGMLVGKIWQAFRVSLDEGRTWTDIKQEVPCRQIYFFDGERIIGAGGG